MRIDIRDIPPEGLHWEQKIKPAQIGLAEDYFKALSPMRITAFIEKVDDEVLVNAQVEGQYEMTCGRCLESVKQKRNDEFDFVFDIAADTEFVELAEDLRQELLISLTGVAVCRPDCKGICQECGAMLNREKCRCRPGDKAENRRGIDIKK